MARRPIDFNTPPPANPSGGPLARAALIAAIVAGLVWLVAAAWAAVMLATDPRLGAADIPPALLLILAGAAPAAAALAAWALAMSAERLERRIARLERIADEAAAAPGDGDRLARAMASAAREALDAERGAMARRLAEIGEAQRVLGAQLDRLAGAVPAAPTPAPAPQPAARPEPQPPAARRAPDPQPALPLAGGAAAEPDLIDWATVATALDFPRDEHDAKGFDALRASVRHRIVSEVLQVAEDMLTMLSQDGLYMEDYAAAEPPLAVWRAYLDGARGADVAAICGVTDETAEARIRERLQKDAIFRDTVMHLIRRYDTMLRRAFAENAPHEVLRGIIDNRTGRAFMFAARAVGSFD